MNPFVKTRQRHYQELIGGAELRVFRIGISPHPLSPSFSHQLTPALFLFRITSLLQSSSLHMPVSGQDMMREREFGRSEICSSIK